VHDQTHLVRLIPYCLYLALVAYAPAQVRRVQDTQEHLINLDMHFVKPDYPREARLARIEGKVELRAVFGDDGSVVELEASSGDKLLAESATKAVRQWRINYPKQTGPLEHEIKLTFTFRIEEPPKPAYIHLKNGNVIRADSVREFTDRVEYTTGNQTHVLPEGSATGIDGCARVSLYPKNEGDCIPSGGPTFDTRAVPLLPAGGK
jgi:TonB family protein